MIFTSPCLGISAAVGDNTLGRITVTDQYFSFKPDNGRWMRKLLRQRPRVYGAATDIKDVLSRNIKEREGGDGRNLYEGQKLLTLLTSHGEISVVLSATEADFAAAQVEQLIQSLAPQD